MSDWREYEFKAALAELTPLEQMSVFAAVAARWALRYVVRRREWVVVDDYPVETLQCNVSTLMIIIGYGVGG